MTRFSVPRPAPSRHSASVATFASFSIAAGNAEALAHHAASETSSSGMLIEPSNWPVVRSITDGIPNPSAADRRSDERLDRRGDPLQQLLLRAGRRRHLAAVVHAPLAVDRPGQDLRAAEIDADDSLGAHRPRLPYPAGWRTEKSPTGSTRAAGPGGRFRPRPAPSGSRRERTAACRRSGRPRWRRRIGLIAAAALRAPRRLDGRELPLVPGRRRRRERAAAQSRRGGPGAAGGRARLEAVADAAARHRRRQDRSALRRAPLRLDPARPDRPRPAPARRTSRSRATCASTSPATARTRSTPPTSSAGPL